MGPGPPSLCSVARDDSSKICVRIVSPIQFSNSLSQRFAARVLCGAGYAVVHFRSLVKYEGMARREGASGSSVAHLPFGKMRRLSARHRGVLNGDGPRFRQPPAGRSTTLRTRPLSGDRAVKPRTRRAARHQPAPGGRSLCLQAEPRHRPGVGGCVHPPPAGAASCSTIKTPHDSALVEQDAHNVRALEAVGITFLS